MRGFRSLRYFVTYLAKVSILHGDPPFADIMLYKGTLSLLYNTSLAGLSSNYIYFQLKSAKKVLTRQWHCNIIISDGDFAVALHIK